MKSKQEIIRGFALNKKMGDLERKQQIQRKRA